MNRIAQRGLKPGEEVIGGMFSDTWKKPDVAPEVDPGDMSAYARRKHDSDILPGSFVWRNGKKYLCLCSVRKMTNENVAERTFNTLFDVGKEKFHWTQLNDHMWAFASYLHKWVIQVDLPHVRMRGMNRATKEIAFDGRFTVLSSKSCRTRYDWYLCRDIDREMYAYDKSTSLVEALCNRLQKDTGEVSK